MFHYFGRCNTGSGDSLPAWQVEVVQLADLSTVIPLYANESGTPIGTVSGITNRAVCDAQGEFHFFVNEGTYAIRYYSAEGVYQSMQRYVQMYAGTASGKANASALGVSDGAADMGVFTGTTIPNNVSAKAGMQALETSLDTANASLLVMNQTGTGTFYAGDGARIQRYKDRVFIAGATANNGTNTGSQPDWLTTYELSKGRSFGFLQGAQVAILNDNTAYSSNGLVVAAQTKNYADARNAIGTIGVGVNNNTTYATGAWGGYFEGYRNNSVVGPTYGSEHDTINFVSGSAPVTTPYSQAGNQVVAIQIANGGEFASGVYEASAAINVRDNGAKYARGIVIGATALTGSDGVTGTAEWASLPKGAGQIWYASGGAQVSAIYGTATTAAKGATFNLTDDRVVLSNFSSGKWIFRVENIGTGSVNYPGVVPSATGNPVQVQAYGDDTNVGLQLVPKGTGKIIASGVISQTTYTVATLPTGAVGDRAFVTDATSTTFASAVSGGGSNKVPVYYDGAWKIG